MHAGLAITYARVFDYDFSVLEEHRRQTDASLTKAVFDMDHRWIAVRDTVQQEDLVTAFAEEYHETAELLPRLQWNAQLLLVYSTFEHSLNKLCEFAQHRTGSPLNLESFRKSKNIRDRGIYRAMRYLDEIAGITAPFMSANWRFMCAVNRLRNVVAHSNGELENPLTARQATVIKDFQDDPRLRVTKDIRTGDFQRVRLTPDLIHGVIHAAAQVVQDVCAAEPSTQAAIPTK